MIKSQIPNYKSQTNSNNQNFNRPYNLEERTLEFTKGVVRLCQKLSKNSINFKLIEQLVDASTSVGANYREANDALSKKDFVHRLKISRKECKETSYWLELIKEPNPDFKEEVDYFIRESQELRNILTAIINKQVNLL